MQSQIISKIISWLEIQIQLYMYINSMYSIENIWSRSLSRYLHASNASEWNRSKFIWYVPSKTKSYFFTSSDQLEQMFTLFSSDSYTIGCWYGLQPWQGNIFWNIRHKCIIPLEYCWYLQQLWKNICGPTDGLPEVKDILTYFCPDVGSCCVICFLGLFPQLAWTGSWEFSFWILQRSLLINVCSSF